MRFKTFNKKELSQLRYMSHEDSKKIMDRMPSKMLAFVLANSCSPVQVKQVFGEYHMYCSDSRMSKQLGDPEIIQARYKDKILALCKALKKARKSNLIPLYIRENYL